MVDYSKYEFLKVEKKEKVATITLNRPDSLNSVGYDVHHELEDIFVDVDKDEEVNAVLLTGAGRAFSAGGDIKRMIKAFDDPSLRTSPSQVKELVNNLLQMKKPIVAAVNGDAIGLGASLALCCDIIIASENARIGDPHVNVGLVPGDGGLIIWPLLLGMCKAKEFLMAGSLVKAPDAERMGLINKAVPAESLMEEAWGMAKRFADGPIQAISWTKVCLNKILLERMNLLMDAGVAYEFHSMNLPDHLEAAKAFTEKRPPQFKGRVS